MQRPLKQGPNRSVWLDEQATPTVVKRFHSRGRLARLLDRRRATREHRLLRALALRGLPVPVALGLERVQGHWQVRSGWIPGAYTLEDVLAGRAPWPVEPRRVARRLGQLLGLGHARGVRQLDLHAGNVLLDARGAPWIVDPLGVRFGPLDPQAAREDLARACGFLRERSAPGLRARALVAWRRAAPGELARAVLARPDAAAGLERAGRRERARALRGNAARWTRTSGVLREVSAGGEPWLVRRLRPHDGPGTPALEALTPRERRRQWMLLGRLFEHGLAVPTPARVAPRRGWAVELDDLEGLRPLPERAPDLPPRARRRFALHLGELLGALRERGFDPGSLRARDLWADGDARLRLAPECAPRERWDDAFGPIDARRFALHGPPSERERALFVCGVRRALGGARVEREAWSAELRGR